MYRAALCNVTEDPLTRIIDNLTYFCEISAKLY